ncbi:tubulin-like doman-containing protein [Botrimarina sp.]|uniref:protein kinase domain-containing protein n=1 Tax=Botrimarina sp. TaxID=2795802 RepID=UPI0032F059A5
MPVTDSAPRLPDGYTLIDRLGAGGYGEVWRATAPGGVEKAVKVVFGHCDAELADRERKSLERVRSVRHPFLLTIERYEIVDNRLIIVTELADSSLDQLFRQRRADGHPGVPRDQLLRLMADAAEGLDCLSEQHDLQHLDVKPENLLLVGDHSKVADYGLVKQLASRTQQSMVGGMTPLYSAPEVFDGAPTRSSDQYSLAIVYQYVLTGVLPFAGQTVSQLVKQHTMAEPNLGPLGDDDRLVIARALSKDPGDRYPSCRKFVQALAQTAATDAGAPAARPTARAPVGPDDTKSVLAISTQPLGRPKADGPARRPHAAEFTPPAAPAPARPRTRLPAGPSEVIDLAAPEGLQLAASARPTLFVGLGGVGSRMLAAAKGAWSAFGDHAPPAAWLAIDTDRDQLTDLRRDAGLAPGDGDGDTLHVPLRRPKDYRAADPALLRGVSRRWLYHIPRSLTTRGYRPLGRIALVDNAQRVARTLAAKLQSLATADKPEPVRVVVLAGGCGGAGGGMLIDLAQAVRSVGEAISTPLSVEAVLGLPSQLRPSDQLGAASLMSLLIELHHSQQAGNTGSEGADGWIARFERDQPPFDQVSLCTAPPPRATAGASAAMGLLATAAFDLAALDPGADGVGSVADAYRVLGAVDCDHLAQTTSARSTLELRTEALRLLREVDPNKHVSRGADARSAAARTPQDAAKQAATVRKSFAELLDAIDERPPLLGADTPPELSRLAARVADRFVESVADQLSSGEPGGVVRCTRLLDKLVREAITPLVDEADLADQALAAIGVDPLGCGYRRRLVAICPRGERPSALLEALKARLPQLAVTEADVPHTMLVNIGRGPTAPFLASRIESVFADAVDAGKRLHTRIDVDWGEFQTVERDASAPDTRDRPPAGPADSDPIGERGGAESAAGPPATVQLAGARGCSPAGAPTHA